MINQNHPPPADNHPIINNFEFHPKNINIIQ